MAGNNGHEAYMPVADPRPFLEERTRLLYEQAEPYDPGGPHESVERFERLAQEFLEGKAMAESLCLYAMTLYLGSQDKLAGSDAAVTLISFPADFAKYVGIDDERLHELWKDAEWSVDYEDPRLKRVQEYRDGTREFPYPIVALEKGPLDNHKTLEDLIRKDWGERLL